MSDKKISITKVINKNVPESNIVSKSSIKMNKSANTNIEKEDMGNYSADINNEIINCAENSDEYLTELKDLSIKDVTKWFVVFFTPGILNCIKDNPNFTFSTLNENVDLDEWMENVIKTLLPYNNILQLGQVIKKKYYRMLLLTKKTIIANKELENNLSQNTETLNTLKKEFDEAAVQIFNLGKKIKTSVQIESLIDLYFSNRNEFLHLKKLFYESVNDANENLNNFFLGFVSGWTLLEKKLFFNKEIIDETEYLNEFDNIIKELLKKISGLYISQRRALLNEIAKIVSKSFDDYEFISPEDFRQIDPKIHNVKNINGSTVKEGVSFAVIRKESRQTVIYAEIITE